MCLGIAGRVVALDPGDPNLGTVDFEGTRREVNLTILGGGVAPGDWILVHLGFALQRLTPEEAAASRATREQLMGVAGEADR